MNGGLLMNEVEPSAAVVVNFCKARSLVLVCAFATFFSNALRYFLLRSLPHCCSMSAAVSREYQTSMRSIWENV